MAILTSGGDAPGMNPAVRGVVKRALAAGAEVWAVRDGYAGLVAGDLVRADASDVSGILELGGTVLGTARSDAFRTLEGRRAAAGHLLRAGIDRLVVVGGDGSLTGADALRAEWPDHAVALVADGLDPAVADAHPALRVVGLVGSIDNDFWGTDNTLGCDTALHRIVEAVDMLASTARSHQRTFVVEVMGRRCGYLAVAAASCTGADFVLVPEAPLPDWDTRMCEALRAGRDKGKRKSIVIVAEGACDVHGARLSADRVKAAIEDGIGAETRVTVLGHVQRGGAPSAEDRVMGTVLGAAAADRVLSMAADDAPVVLGTAGPEVIARPLAECVDRTLAVGRALAERRFADAFAARGPEFADLYNDHTDVTRPVVPAATGRRVLVLNVGAPAPGMNAALRAVVRLALQKGCTPLAAEDGLDGLLRGDLRPYSWMDVSGIASLGSTRLGTNRHLPDPDAVNAALATHAVDAVVFVGGYESLVAASRVSVPAAVVPATISNNVPCTDRSIGCDTATNAIVEAVDRLKLSARGSRRRVFVVQVMGRRCGYLATVGGVGAGAEVVHTHEAGLGLDQLRRDATALNAAFDAGRQVAVVLVADGALGPLDAAGLARVLEAEAAGRFDTRVCVLGHLQQGGRPSPRDRLLATRLGTEALDRLLAGEGGFLVGIRAGDLGATPLADALAAADAANRRPRQPRHTAWLRLWPGL